MDIVDKKKNNSKRPIMRSIGVVIVSFIISIIIVTSFRETIDVNEITTYKTNLDKIGEEVEEVKNKILTTQKSIDELESFINENNN